MTEAVRAVIHAEMLDTYAPLLGELIGELIEKRCAPLEAKIAKLEAAQSQSFKYLGTWEEGREYQKGCFVSHGGSIHHCLSDNRDTKPGNGSAAWVVAVPRARDGRDGKDAPALKQSEPEQRRPTAQRSHR
jgi:hypothetical protein